MSKRSFSASDFRRFGAFILLFGLMLGSAFLPSCAKNPERTVETLIFTDDLGREVSAPMNPSRVACLIGSFADIWTDAGGTVIATADDAWDDFHLELPADCINLGSTKNPSLEALLSANPDFVIASAATAKNLEFREILENAGIPVAYFDVSTFEDYLRMLSVLVKLTGRHDLYLENGEGQREGIDEIIEKSKSIRGEKILFLRASSGYIRAKGSEGSVLGEMLLDLGCKNIADSDTSLLENLSIEAILRENPDRIFIVGLGDDEEAIRKNIEKMTEENSAWKTLSAVKEGRVHYMDKRLYNLKPNSRWLEAYEGLYEILARGED